ncbi:MAG TPA: beta-ketoacyl-[acyl-carrier-protein] synthase family protein [Brumimicrobium sp.]|nr:beta-ketoacyl-[acyl-carrier-protein] synthase family protein [Brumimicrobium sp.]
MAQRIAITGMGIVSAIGMNVEENLTSLKGNKHGISKIENIDTILKDSIYVGEIKKSNEELLALLGITDSINNFSRTSMLGALAVKEAIETAEIDVRSENIGFINSTTVGGMDIIERYYNTFEFEKDKQHYIEVHDAGNNTNVICNHLGIKGMVTTISTACSSAANAIMLGARLLKSGRLDKVIVGGMDGLCKFTINGFNTLMILSDTYNQPFDNNRKGLNLGEGAAYLVLESEKSYKKRGKTPLAHLVGYANSNDAFHQTASSEDGEGAFLAMEEAFKVAEINVESIDYVNAHGTATPNNDLSEGRAMLNIFKNKVPDFSSTKPFTGHTLAAAASVEAVFSILAIREKMIYPNLNFTTKMDEFDLIPNRELKNKEVNAVLSNSFGFGGNCSSLIFVK